MYEVDQYTVSLLHFEDGIKDETGKVWTPQNNASTSSVESRDGFNALLLNGNQCIYTAVNQDFNFSNGDFTIDAWITYTGENNYQIVCGKWCQQGGDGDYLLGIRSNKLSFVFGAYSQYADLLTGNTIIPANTWNHVAVVRSSNEFTIFLNGKIEAKSTFKGSALNVNFPLSVGAYGDFSRKFSVGFFKGYIDELRISKGIARWTADFTVPSAIISPTNLIATADDCQVALSWKSVTGAAAYNVKRSITKGGPYTTITAKLAGITYVDTAVKNDTTYYYIVTAIDSDGNESANSNETSATPKAGAVTPPTGNALLRVTVIDSSEREYELPIDKIDGFISWYNSAISTGNPCHMLDKKVGSQNSKEYLAFDKIISFEVIPLKD